MRLESNLILSCSVSLLGFDCERLGKEGALTVDSPLQAKTGEHVRIYFGNAGPNLWSAFHVIGGIFEKVWRDADLVSPPARFIQTTGVPPGGATVVDLHPVVPGTYTLVDHAIFRLDKGAGQQTHTRTHIRARPHDGCKQDPAQRVRDLSSFPLLELTPAPRVVALSLSFSLSLSSVGYLNVTGKERPDLDTGGDPAPCPGCKLHP